jgi:hypothetical protein
MRRAPGRRLILALVCVLLCASGSSTAQRRNRTDTASFGIPTATNAIVENPAAFEGKLVTVSAGVEQVFSKTVFLVDQRKAVGASEVKAIGKPIMVIAPALAAGLDGQHYLLIRGTVVTFDPAAITGAAPGYTLDLPLEARARFEGTPVLVASSVVDSTFTELAPGPR